MNPASGSADTGAVNRLRLGIALRVGVYALLVILGIQILPLAIIPIAGYFAGAAISSFAAAAIANAVTVRIFGIGPPRGDATEPGTGTHGNARLSDIGLGWNPSSVRNLLLGVAGGAGGALLVLLPPLALGAAHFVPTPDTPFNFGPLIFVLFVLLFGAIGEELLFRGYGFQVLVGTLGPFATILPTAMLFALAHAWNQNYTVLGMINTGLWGIVLGFAVVRAGDLWMASGLHFGWNALLPLFGANLSGFTMRVTGYAMEWRAGNLWSGGAYGPEASLLTTAVAILLIVYLNKAPIRRQYPPLLGIQPED
jgi:uncharacterized protein